MRLQAHFLAADFAAPRVVAVWSSVAEFQALAIRFTANVFTLSQFLMVDPVQKSTISVGSKDFL